MLEFKRMIRGEDHSLLLLKVRSRDELGRPKEVMVLYADDVENIKGDVEFVTCYVPTKMVAKTVS